MRNILCACLIAVAAVTCNAQQKVKDYAVLSGTIANFNSDYLMISGYGFRRKISVNEDGTFRDTLKVRADIYRFSGEPDSWAIIIYLKNGYDLTISLDADSLDAKRPYSKEVAFEGTGAVPNNYLLRKDLLEKELVMDPNLFNSGFGYFTKQLKTYIDGMSEGLYNTKNMDSYVVEFQEEKTEAMKNYMVVDYVRKSFWQSDSTMFDMEEPEFIAKAVDAYIADVVQSFTSDTEEAGAVAFKISDETWQRVKKSLVDEFKQRKFIAEFKGKPSPIFTDYVSFDGGTASLADFKGKYVYIDVWATWCGPCLAEIPSLKAVEEEYRSKNIAFVSISVDKEINFDTWKAMIKDKELSGIQLFATNSFESPFIEGYKIQGIPRFILIDPEGNVVSANAPRPSDPELKALFEELKI